MKKVLSVLLTLVMTICLINLNLSHINAEDTNVVDYGLVLKQNGTITKPDGTIITPAGLEYDATNQVWKMENFNFETTNSPALTFEDNITIQIKGTNSIKLSGNLVEGFEDVGYWTNTIFGPYGKTLTIKSFDNSNTPTLNIDNVNTNNNVDTSAAISLADKLCINSGTINVNTTSIGDRSVKISRLEINDGVLSINATNYLALSLLNTASADNLSITGKGLLKMKTNNASLSECINMIGNQTTTSELNSLYDVKATGQTTTVLSKALFEWDGSMYTTIRLPNSEKALYAEVSKIMPEPTPTPSPSKKDESCEKVIGPTWHWNNEKGVCEEYATVGTYTR